MKAWTDYPLIEIDTPHELAPVREVKIVGYDGDKYCQAVFDGKKYEIKRGYIFTKPGRVGEVDCFRHLDLDAAFNPTRESVGL